MAYAIGKRKLTVATLLTLTGVAAAAMLVIYSLTGSYQVLEGITGYATAFNGEEETLTLNQDVELGAATLYPGDTLGLNISLSNVAPSDMGIRIDLTGNGLEWAVNCEDSTIGAHTLTGEDIEFPLDGESTELIVFKATVPLSAGSTTTLSDLSLYIARGDLLESYADTC